MKTLLMSIGTLTALLSGSCVSAQEDKPTTLAPTSPPASASTDQAPVKTDDSHTFHFTLSDYKGDYLDLPRPGNKPEKFAPGFVSVETQSVHGLVFAPDGKQLAYMLDDPAGWQKGIRLVYMRQIDGRWTHPIVLEFSQTGWCVDPVFTADGKRIIFTRPVGKDRVECFFCEISAEEYSAPRIIDLHVPAEYYGPFGYSEDASGNVYFCSKRPGNCGGTDIYQLTRRADGPKINHITSLCSPVDDDSPFVSADGRYLVFNRVSEPTPGHHESDVVFSYRTASGEWSPPVNYSKHFGATDLNWRPTITSDGKYLFFGMRNGKNFGVYWVSARVLEELKPKTDQMTDSDKNANTTQPTRELLE